MLFATFNQSSTFTAGEADVTMTTTERLLRSYVGGFDLDVTNAQETCYGVESFIDLIGKCRQMSPNNNIGFMFCLDECQKIKSTHKRAYTALLDALCHEHPVAVRNR